MGHALVIGKDVPLAAALQAGGTARGHEVHRCSGNVEALQVVRQRAVDVVTQVPLPPLEGTDALVRELTSTRPGLKIIVLAPAATHGDLMAALRAHVFACFTPPFEPGDIVDMLLSALNASDWQDGLELVSGLPHWFTLRVSCHLLTAERLVRFMTEHLSSLPADERNLLIAAFRELLLNAMEHGAGFDHGKVVEVTAARTARAIVYHVRDPGTGFNRQCPAALRNGPSARRLRHAHRTHCCRRTCLQRIR